MVVVLPDPSGLGAGITGASGILAQALMQRQQQQEQARQRGLLGQLLGQADLQQPGGLQAMLQQAGEQNLPLDQVLSMAQQVAPRMQQDAFLARQGPDELANLLQQFGLEEERAQAYGDMAALAPTGGRTKIIEAALEEVQRAGPLKDPKLSAQAGEGPDSFPEMDTFAGLTPKERVGMQKELRKLNKPDFDAANSSLKGARQEKVRLDTLERLNERGNLPEGLGRWNVDIQKGTLNFPAAANQDTQTYVKLINDWISGAKDTFGARVTNFELGVFLSRLPTLANTQDGRTNLLKYMQGINRINTLYNESLKDVYSHYKLGGVSPEDAQMVAYNRVADEIAEIEQSLPMDLAPDAENPPEVPDVGGTVEMKQARDTARAKLAPGNVLMELNGKLVQVPPNLVEQAIQNGYRQV